ncbi:MAG TPA: hypothetical protein VMF09_09485 [Solirubrobacteraceae bacterium]|nr:hypothetical protein [Solirubrobacteraceae bacterium]
MSGSEAAATGGLSLKSLVGGGRARVSTRGVQIALGVVWLMVGLFQFKSFMYTHGLISEVFGEAMEKQPSWVAVPMKTIDDFYGRDLTLWNTLAAQIQLAIGLGLIVGRKTVKPALLASFGWALAVWWFGEGFGGLVSNTLPAPLMGAPGAVILYALIGVLVWPTDKRAGRSPAGMGPLGERGAQLAWAGLWMLGAFLWLVDVNRAKGATAEMIKGMAEASPHWLAKIQDWAVHHAQGHGTTVAITLAVLSVAIALGVFAPSPLRWAALALGIVISLGYWLFGQSLGGPFWAGGATDFNAAPLYVLLAVALFPLAQRSPQEQSEGLATVATAQTGRRRVSSAI